MPFPAHVHRRDTIGMLAVKLEGRLESGVRRRSGGLEARRTYVLAGRGFEAHQATYQP